jgi:hypothetical protein
MATRNKLSNVSPHELARIANQGGGQKAAAAAHGVTQSSVSLKLKDAGYRMISMWIAPDEKVLVEKESA